MISNMMYFLYLVTVSCRRHPGRRNQDYNQQEPVKLAQETRKVETEIHWIGALSRLSLIPTPPAEADKTWGCPNSCPVRRALAILMNATDGFGQGNAQNVAHPANRLVARPRHLVTLHPRVVSHPQITGPRRNRAVTFLTESCANAASAPRF